MDYEKKDNEALKRAKAAIDIAADKDLVKGVATTIFPELRESEDERMIREFNDWLCEEIEWRTNDLRDEEDRRTLNMLCYVLPKVKAWLEKQKEPEKEELVYRLNGLMQEYINEGEDDNEKEHRMKCYCLFWDALEDTSYFEHKEQKQTDLPAGFYYIDQNGNRYYSKEFRYGDMKLKVGEQKPISTEDMPYVADEHFFEREPADSFKYRLAEYMTKNCKKGEGPYGYSYNISSESILQMAKEELLKRGELKDPKPAWSEEDEKMRSRILDIFACDQKHYLDETAWLKSLRPQPKQEWSDEEKGILLGCISALQNSSNWLLADKLSSLCPQPKQEWSEEDKSILEALIYDIERLPMQGVLTHRPCDSYIKFLKALRPGWKPTEEQMDALAYAIKILDDGLSPKAAKAGEELEHLREQLKKL